MLEEESSRAVLQDAKQGFGEMVATIMAHGGEETGEAESSGGACRAQPRTLSWACSAAGRDALSGVTANPAVGCAADLLVRAGATVMFSEVTEVRDAAHLLTARAATPEIARDFVREMAWYDEYLRAGRRGPAVRIPRPATSRAAWPMWSRRRWDRLPRREATALMGVTGPGERVTQKGLVFAATPASDFICGTLQLAASMNMHIFTTGRGTPYGLAMAPVIKVASNSGLAERWHDLIDVDAGRIATAEATVEEVGWEIFSLILEVASGRKKTWADHWGLHNEFALFNPGPVT